jgi:putative transposase
MPTPLSALSDQERARAVARFEILRPFFHDHIPLAQIARQQQLPLRTLTRWVQRYRAEGLAGLVRKRRRDHGHHRLHPTLQQLIEGLALQHPPLSVRAIHRHVSALAHQHALKPPSYGLVYAIIGYLRKAGQLDVGQIR